MNEAAATSSAESYHGTYQKAFELAATKRYPEAREKLLQILGQHPDAVDALVLLGKVEYYLGKKAASRQRFETALTYQPDNLPAWFALQFYREQKFTAALALALALVAIIVLSSAVLLYRGLDDRLNHQTTVQTEQLCMELATSTARLATTVDATVDTAIKTITDRSSDEIALLEGTILEQLRLFSTDLTELENRLRGLKDGITDPGKRLPADPPEDQTKPGKLESSLSD